jgi:SAM-dependent methyltransferase
LTIRLTRGFFERALKGWFMNCQLIDSVKPVDDEIDRAATYVFAILDSYQNIFKRLGLSPDGLTILELGPGADFGAQLILASMGAKMILADRFLTQFNPDYHPRLYAEVARRWDGPKGQLEAAVKYGHEASNLQLIAQPVEDLNAIPSASIDLVYSNAVLEHIYDVSCATRECARITKIGGFGSHQIDWRDHRDFKRPLEHLTLREEDYRKEAEPAFYGFGNRLRSIEFWGHFEAEGFFVVERETNDRPENTYLFNTLPKIRSTESIYRHWPESDLARTGGRLLMRRESGKEESAARTRGEDLLSVIAALKSA